MRLIFCAFLGINALAHAFDVEQIKNEIVLELSKNIRAGSTHNPVLILIGGYPGAGKTTLIRALVQKYNIATISWDAIRQALLDRKVKGSPYDWEIIEAVNANLFRMCLQNNANIVIDANAYAKNIEFFERLLEAEQAKERYHVIKICLNTPYETLLRRVRDRKQLEDVHQGTEADLIKNFNAEYKKIDLNDYSLVIKNDEVISFETELNIVNSLLESYFDQQQPD